MNVMIKVIQNRRLQKGFNFHDIERATGIPSKRMHSFEKGSTHLSLEEIDRLFDFLNLKQSDLVMTRKKGRKPRLLIFTALATFLFVTITLFIVFAKTDGISPFSFADLSQSENELLDSDTTMDINEDTTVMGPANHPKGIHFRFWGNMQYQSVQLPLIELTEPDYEIIPVEQLSIGDSLPNWLSAKDKDHILLNFATRFIWGDGVEKERDRLNKMGYKNTGLDYLAEVYKPYILDTDEGKVGVLSFTRTILDAEHIAEKNEIGLAKVYDQAVLLNAIENAKQEVEVLIVLIGWGDREGESRDQKQRDLAQLMVTAGADLIVGNHSIHGQEVEWIDGVPVFYSLGHAISDMTERNQVQEQAQETYAYVLDMDLIDKAFSNLQIHIGRLVDGQLTFDLSEQEKEQIEHRLYPQMQQIIEIR